MSDLTVGVEEEYQLVDPETGELQSRARAVLATDWTDEVKKEVHESTLEIGTRICHSAGEVEEELKRLRFQTATAAAAEELELVAAGLHPTSSGAHHLLTAGERYARISAEYRRIVRHEHIFGMHIHVAVPTPRHCIRLLNAVRFYLPHLLALSCSSPYSEGADTGYASYRAVLWRRWPTSGVPPYFRSRGEYRAHVDLLLRSGAIGDEHNLYWSVRPHPEYPTLELRITDVCPRVDDAAAIVALARAIVAGLVDGVLEENPWPGISTDRAHALLSGNEWRAARYGLEAKLVDPTASEGTTGVRSAIGRLVDRLSATAEAQGDGPALGRVASILERGNGAERMRRVLDKCGDFAALVSWLSAETMLGTGLDRRREQRKECA